MRAVTWHGPRDVRVTDVPDPRIEDSTDATVEVTSTAICGSDLHLYEVLSMFMDPGDVLVKRVGIDRLSVLRKAIRAVRRGGTLSITGVYGGQIDPMPMMDMFDKGVQVRMGQGHVKRWVGDIMPLLLEGSDPLGTETFATHHLPLEEAPGAYAMFQEKRDGALKVVLQP